jgi:FlgN protein
MAMPDRVATESITPGRTDHGQAAMPPVADEHDDAWASLCTRLWVERDLLEELLFKLTEVQLVAGSGSTRWLNKADDEARRALVALQDTEVVRAVAVEDLIRRCQLGSDSTLRELIAIAPTPWDSLLSDHCEALRNLALSIDAVANENRRRLQLGLDTTQEALERVQAIRATYDARGDAVAQRPGAYLLDQQA